MIGTRVGLRRDTRSIVVGMLRHSSTALTTPQIVARAGVGRATIALQLAALEAEGAIGRIVGKPQCWCWRADPEETASE